MVSELPIQKLRKSEKKVESYRTVVTNGLKLFAISIVVHFLGISRPLLFTKLLPYSATIRVETEFDWSDVKILPHIFPATWLKKIQVSFYEGFGIFYMILFNFVFLSVYRDNFHKISNTYDNPVVHTHKCCLFLIQK